MMSLRKIKSIAEVILVLFIIGIITLFYLGYLDNTSLTLWLVIITAVYSYLTYKISTSTKESIEEIRRQAQIAFYEKKLEKVYNPLLNSKIDIKRLWTFSEPKDRIALINLFSELKPFVHLIEDRELSKKVRLCIECSREGHTTLSTWDEFRQNDTKNIHEALQNLWEKQIEPKLEEEAQSARDKIESLMKG